MTATADLYDERGDALASVSVPFQDLGGRRAFEGPIRTIRCFRDNGLVKDVLATPGEGAVLVVDGGGSLESALMGDIMASSAVENGWAGVIVYGAIRDRDVLATLDATAVVATYGFRDGDRVVRASDTQVTVVRGARSWPLERATERGAGAIPWSDRASVADLLDASDGLCVPNAPSLTVDVLLSFDRRSWEPIGGGLA